MTVKNPSLSVSASKKKLTVGETSKLTVKKRPLSATVKYSSSDEAVASVSKGVITANGAGTAVITAKLTCGKKTISKKITIQVTEAVNDGISVTLQNQFSKEYPNVVVSNHDINKDHKAIVRVYYGRNGKGVNNEYLHVRYTDDGGKTYQTTRLRTDDVNGVAYWEVGCADKEVSKVDYTITPENDSAKEFKGSFSFASITTKDIKNVNIGKVDNTDYKTLGYEALTVSDNDKVGANNGDGRTLTNGTYTYDGANGTGNLKSQYTSEYVDSQQVSVSGTDKNKVGFVGGLPYITLPGDSDAINTALDFKQDVNLTSGSYDTYADKAQYVTLNVDPNELTYATMHFTSLTLSKYTRLEISAYPTEADAKAGKNQIGTTTFVYGPHSQSDFAYQIPLTSQNGKSMCIKVRLVSAGQVNTDTNKGYVIKDITGVYKSKKGSNQTTALLKGAKIEWKAVSAEYSEEKPLASTTVDNLLLADDVQIKVGMKDTSTQKDVEKVTYRVPVFPYTGNAVITTYDKNGAVIAYFACPTVNNGVYDVATTYNENVLAENKSGKTLDAKYVYRISQEEAFNNVGTVSQDGELVTVNSDKAGITNLKGTITGVEGLDATNSSVYTSVQWNPVKNAVAGSTGAVAFAGQEVTVTAQLVDKNGNKVANANEPVSFKYVQNGASATTDISGTGAQAGILDSKKVSVLQIQKSTDSQGQAKLLLTAPDAGTVMQEIQASTSRYNVVLTVNGESVDKLDLYWIEARPAFGPTASDEPAGKKDTKVDTDITDTTTCVPTIGENWEYAFTTADETLANAGVWAAKKVTISNAKVDVKANAGSKGTVKTDTGVNGMVTASPKEPGQTKLTGTVDGTAFDSKGVTFKVGDKETKNVGTGKASFTNKQLLTVNWQTAGTSGAFVDPVGTTASTGAAFTVYFRAADKMGNANTTADITEVTSSETGSITGVVGATSVAAASISTASPLKPDTNGIVKITLNNSGKTDKQKETISVRLDGVVYTETITWKAPKTATLDVTTVNGKAVASSNDPYKTYADKDKIVLTFDQDIYAPSNMDAFKRMFTVSRKKLDNTGTAVSGDKEAVKIGDVTVSGNTVTIKFDGADNSVEKYEYYVEVKGLTDNSVTYNLTSTDGYAISNTGAAVTCILRDKNNDTAPSFS